MKTKIVFYAALCGALLFFAAHNAQAAAPAASGGAASAAQSAAATIWKAEQLTLTALLDVDNAMPIGLFSGPAGAEERAGYFPGGKAPASINAFLIRTGGSDSMNILVDTGYGKPAGKGSRLPEALQTLGLGPEDIDLILLTHMHPDHIGGLLSENPPDKNRVFSRAKILVAAKELSYWTGLAKTRPDNSNAAQVKAVTAAYGADIQPPFEFGAYLRLPGNADKPDADFAIKALDAAGHTPGHTVFQVEKSGQKFLIIGDLVHAVDLQFAIPEECPSFDLDKAAAIASRRRILDLAAMERVRVAGMHIPFTGTGLVEKTGSGYRLIPE